MPSQSPSLRMTGRVEPGKLPLWCIAPAKGVSILDDAKKIIPIDEHRSYLIGSSSECDIVMDGLDDRTVLLLHGRNAAVYVQALSGEVVLGRKQLKPEDGVSKWPESDALNIKGFNDSSVCLSLQHPIPSPKEILSGSRDLSDEEGDYITQRNTELNRRPSLESPENCLKDHRKSFDHVKFIEEKNQ